MIFCVNVTAEFCFIFDAHKSVFYFPLSIEPLKPVKTLMHYVQYLGMTVFNKHRVSSCRVTKFFFVRIRERT